ncbi:MAG TPA: hydroxyisourate hydrolase [Thermoanaerobaculia bacterium]|nr:hydroxyisourate hydrolase [Thermoanaerobaculia bacterium]
MSGITTHVLDTSRGRPASGVPVLLEMRADEGWREIARAETDADGRVRDLLPPEFPVAAGTWRLTFDVGTYFDAQGVESFYPEASIIFVIRDAGQHYHVPLLLSPYGYSTYRGS